MTNITPRSDERWEGGFVRDTTTGEITVKVTQGSVALSTSDIEVGAVEIKDGSSDTRAQVLSAAAADTGQAALAVRVVSQPTGSTGLTNTELRATPVPVSGTVTASGPLTDTQLRASAVPVSGPLTDTQLRATAVPVSGTVTASGPLTDTQLRATAVPVSGTVTASGPITDTQIRATPLPVNNANVNGAAVVTSVTGVQDTMPRKRTGATGLSPNYYAARINSKVTTTPTAATAYIQCIIVAVTAAGTAWTYAILDKAATPKTLVPAITAAVPTTGPVIFQFAEPVLMTSGIDIVTAGTTAGTLDIYITYWQ